MPVLEDWREIEGFPDYAVNQFGEVGNMKSGMIRKLSTNRQGIVKVSLYRHGKELHTRSVAVLVAENFVEGQTEIFNTPIHLDGEKSNCAAFNLMWRPRWYAIQYHRQFYIDAFHAKTPALVEINTGQEYDNIKDACTHLGLFYNDVYKSYVSEVETPVVRYEFRML